MKIVNPAIGVAALGLLQEFVPYQASSILSASTLGVNTLYFVPFDIDVNLNADRVNFFVSVATTFANANSTDTALLGLSAALYSRIPGTGSSDVISQIWSGGQSINASMTSGTAMSFTAFGPNSAGQIVTVSTALATSNASTYLATSIAGFREFAMPIGSTLAPGRYWMGVVFSSASHDATLVLNGSVAQQTMGGNIAYQPMGTNSSASNASSPNLIAGMGTYSATSNAFPGTINLNASVILGAPTQTLPFFNFSGYVAGTGNL